VDTPEICDAVWGPKGFYGAFLPDGFSRVPHGKIVSSMYFSDPDKVQPAHYGIEHEAIEDAHDVVTFEDFGNGQTKVTFTGNEPMESADTHLIYSVKTDTLSVRVTDTKSRRETWLASGAIVGAKDLPSSDLQIKLACPSPSIEAQPYLLGSRLHYFRIHVGGDKDLTALHPETVKPILLNHLPAINLKVH